MANFFSDNRDIQFLLDHLDMADLARMQEADFTPNILHDCDYRPKDAEDAVDNYRRILDVIGDIAGEIVAPSAEQIDREGNTLNDDGTVTYHPLVAKNLEWLKKADMMGFVLPQKYGGLNCSILLYTIATEIISRADTSLMNLFGLQGIAETIGYFGSDEISDYILPKFCEGEVTAAMALTEPDAGSDLLSVRLRAYQDEQGEWRLNGVKRFITNGCGEVLLVLALSHPDESTGRGLSFFMAERDGTVIVRHLEDKLGIHGSPTCEIVFNDTPCKVIGDLKRGMIYTMEMMNGARMGIAAQSLGVSEAAFRLARMYANSREQFGGPIEQLPPVAELVTDMAIHIEAGRALTYEAASSVDTERYYRIKMEDKSISKDEKKACRQKANQHKRFNKMLTPMSKYFCSEMSITVTNQSIQVLGGSGFTKDYAAERHMRDARITTIYEGTSQLQVVAAAPAISSGALDQWLLAYDADKQYEDAKLAELHRQLDEAHELVTESIAFIKTKDASYMNLVGRQLVDMSISIVVGYLLLEQAVDNDRKKVVADCFITKQMDQLKMKHGQILSGNTTILSEYDLIAGPVPTVD